MISKKRILLTSGPATTTRSVKEAMMVPDISPREKEVEEMIGSTLEELVKIVHGNDEYTAVPFCGSGTICMDACLNSLIEHKVLILENGQYSRRAVGICDHYNIPFVRLEFPYTEKIDLCKAEEVLKDHHEIDVVYSTHMESATGIVNPIDEIGNLAHKYNAISIVDTLSTFGFVPIDMRRDNIDFCMGASHKGIASFVGFSFVVGRKDIIEKSKEYPSRSFYTNIYMQHDHLNRNGIMQFTPPTPLLYSVSQAIKEYWHEGETEKYNRLLKVKEVLVAKMAELGFDLLTNEDLLSGLIVSWRTPNDSNWDYKRIHDYCFQRDFEIFPTPILGGKGFRLAAFGSINTVDAEKFMSVFHDALNEMEVQVPVKY